MGRTCSAQLKAMRDDPELDAVIADVRGLGLALAVELRNENGESCARDLAERTLYGCLERGLSFTTSHGVVLTLTPALTIAREDLDRAVHIIKTSLAEAVRGQSA